MQRFAKIPLSRLLLPFVVGILLYVYGNGYVNQFFVSVFSVRLLFVMLLFVLILLVFQSFVNIKFLVTLAMDTSLLIFGYAVCYYHDVVHHPDFIGNKIDAKDNVHLIVKPADVVVHKEKYNKAVFDVYQVFNSSKNQWEYARGKILLQSPAHIKLDSNFHINGFYLLNARLQNIPDTKNPYAFNYAEYLRRQGIYYTVYLKEKKDLNFLTDKKFWNIKEWALYVRYKIIMYFKTNPDLNIANKSLASALLTGFDDELDNETIQSFVYSGTLHILSVSGFHTGLVFLLISFLFSLFDPHHRRKWTRTFVIILSLFFYAFMSGFSAPIVRAAVMLSLIVIQQNFYTDRIIHPLNVLSAAAFFVLVYNPLSINDAGFLLSFSAMIGIVYFSPKYVFENRIIQSSWDIISMSIGAQLGTLPIALYFFHSFAFLFIVANLLIVPLTTIIMFVCIIALIPVPLFSIILNYLLQWLVEINRWFYLSNTYYDWIHFNFSDSIILTILIAGSFYLIEKIKEQETHRIQLVHFILLITSIWLIIHHLQYVYSHQKKTLYVYAEKSGNTICIQKNNQAIFNALDSLNMSRWGRNFLLSNCIDVYKIYPFNYIIFNHQKVLMCNSPKDTLLIKLLKPNVVFWNHKKIFSEKLLKMPEIKNIWWIKNNDTKVNTLNGKVKILSYKEWMVW